MATDFNKFLDLFKKPDGTPDREGFARALHFAINGPQILTEAMKQAKNAAIKAQLPDNSQGGLSRGLGNNNAEPTEFQKLMNASVGV